MSNNPFGVNTPAQAPQPQKSSAAKIVLIVLGVIGSLCLIACLGIAGLAYYGFRQVQNVLAELDVGEPKMVKELVQDAPELKAAVGEVRDISWSMQKTIQNTDENSEDAKLWYTVEGTNGSALLEAELNTDAGDDAPPLKSAVLITNANQRVPLTIPKVPYSDPEEYEVYALIRDDQQTKDVVGTIETISVTPFDDENQEYSDYLIKGTSGTVSVVTNFNDNGDIVGVSLKATDGKTWTVGDVTDIELSMPEEAEPNSPAPPTSDLVPPATAPPAEPATPPQQ